MIGSVLFLCHIPHIYGILQNNLPRGVTLGVAKDTYIVEGVITTFRSFLCRAKETNQRKALVALSGNLRPWL